MQHILTVPVTSEHPFQEPVDAEFLSVARVGSNIFAYYLIKDENTAYRDAIMKIVDMRVEDLIPDGYTYLCALIDERRSYLVFIRH